MSECEMPIRRNDPPTAPYRPLPPRHAPTLASTKNSATSTDQELGNVPVNASTSRTPGRVLPLGLATHARTDRHG